MSKIHFVEFALFNILACPIYLLRLPSIENLFRLKVGRSIEHKILGFSDKVGVLVSLLK